jgi:Zn-dependent M28 family amino/carboxypeptidase
MKNKLLFACLMVFSVLGKAQSSADSLLRHVYYLCSFPESRSYNHIEHLNDAAQYIKTNFSACTPHTFIQKFEVKGELYKNVIASFGPEKAKRIIVGAHYDAVNGSPGADANASGVAGLLELARLLSPIQKQLQYRIDLVAYSLSEPPFFNSTDMGSYKHALSLTAAKTQVFGMIDLNSIGYFSDEKKSQRYPFFIYRDIYGSKGNFIALIHRSAMGSFSDHIKSLMKQYAGGIKVIAFKPVLKLKSLERSDCKNYLDLDIPSILVTNTASFRNKNYRTALDMYNTLDYSKMSQVVNMVFQTLLRFKP